MNVKDYINRISGIVSLALFMFMVCGLVFGNDKILGFSNEIMLYVIMPSALIWFGTRKNGCGSCNQTCSVSESKNENDAKSK